MSIQRHVGYLARRNFSYSAEYLFITESSEDPTISTSIDLSSGLIGTAIVLLTLINLAVIVGNVLVLLAVYFERSLRTTTNYFIVNLALADLLLGTLVLPFSGVREVIGTWPFGYLFCDIWAATDVLCCTASINSLCCISIDRYIGVTRPLKHKVIMTPKRAFFINVFVWVFSFFIAVGPLFGWRPPKEPNECPLSDGLDYVMFSVSGSFYLPLLIILVLYAKIYSTVAEESRKLEMSANQQTSHENHNQHKQELVLRIHTGMESASSTDSRGNEDNPPNKSRVSRHVSHSHRRAKFNREKKVAKTLGIVVGVFILCWLPFFAFLPLDSACKQCIPGGIFTFAFWLGYCNSFMNPIIYGAANTTFRRTFKALLTFQYCNKKRHLTMISSKTGPLNMKSNRDYNSSFRKTGNNDSLKNDKQSLADHNSE